MGTLRGFLRAGLVVCATVVPAISLAEPLTQKYLFTVTERYHYASGTTTPFSRQFALTLTLDDVVTGSLSFVGPTNAQEYRSFAGTQFSPTLFGTGLPLLAVPAGAETFGYAEESRSADLTTATSQQSATAAAGYRHSGSTATGWYSYNLGLTLHAELDGSFAGLPLGAPSGASLLALLNAPVADHSFWLSSFAIEFVEESAGGVDLAAASGEYGYSGDSYQYLGTFTAVPEPSTLALVGAGLAGFGALLRLRRRSR